MRPMQRSLKGRDIGLTLRHMQGNGRHSVRLAEAFDTIKLYPTMTFDDCYEKLQSLAVKSGFDSDTERHRISGDIFVEVADSVIPVTWESWVWTQEHLLKMPSASLRFTFQILANDGDKVAKTGLLEGLLTRMMPNRSRLRMEFGNSDSRV